MFANFILASISANAQIVYIDINHIINKSDIGKQLNSYVKGLNNEYITKFQNIEDDLKNKEQSILSKKNILKKEEFEQKLSDLSNEIKKFRINKKKSKNLLEQSKIDNTKKILNLINPVITNYVEENSISLVLPKKNIIVGQKSLDITSDIINILNQQKSTINFK